MGAKSPGPLGLVCVDSTLDVGTLALQRLIAPGPVCGNGNPSYTFNGPILVGKPPRDPGKNPDGTIYEDMFSGDAPAKSASIMSDPVFKLSDAKLQELGRDLMIAASTTGDVYGDYDLQAVALAAWDRFCKGTGGTFTNPTLDAAVRDNQATKTFVRAFEERLRKAILDHRCDLTNFPPLPLGRYAFDTKRDNATGLGILIHDIWSIKAELKNYTGTWDKPSGTGAFYGTLVFTLTDDFGLDWNDIVLHGNDHFPPTLGYYNTGDRFKAWYILQHYRGAKPFFVQVTLEYAFDDRGGRPY